MEAKMFCYQCQETMKGTGCILKGVCGKESHTAKAMDLLMFVVRGISVVTDEFRNTGHPVAAEVNRFVVDALFCTITNANFDDESIMKRIDKGLAMRDDLKRQAATEGISLPEVDELSWTGNRAAYDAKAATVGVLREKNEDLRSLKELIVYGLKGMAAYLEHAMRLGYNDESIHRFMQNAIAKITTEYLSADELTALVHGKEEAEKAQTAAKAVFGGGGNNADMPTTVLKAEELTDGGIGILTLMVRCGLSPSNGEARRLVQQGGVSVNDTKVTDPKSVIYPEAETILRKGKKVFHKVVVEN